MIKLPKNFFTNLTSAQYRDYLKLLPNLNDEKTQLYTMLIFTLAALCIFGIFAINPTLSTIAKEERQLDDLKSLYGQLNDKLQNLGILQYKYSELENNGDLKIALSALPSKLEAPKTVAQINALLSQSGLKPKSLQTYGIEITPNNNPIEKAYSIAFALEAEGSYDNILTFVKSVANLDRIVTIDSISVLRSDKGLLSLKLLCREYFKP